MEEPKLVSSITVRISLSVTRSMMDDQRNPLFNLWTSVLHLGLDFVLVWEVRSRRKRRGKGRDRGEVTGEDGDPAPTEESSRSERRKAQLAQWREKFVQNLESVGLLMEKVLKIGLKIIYLIETHQSA